MKNKFFALLAIVGAISLTNAQSVEIEGVDGRHFSGVHPIVSSEDGVANGYYTHYQTAKGEKGYRTVEFALIDNKLTKVAKTELQVHKRSAINNTVYNGKNFLITWNDYKAKPAVTILKTIDENGKVNKTRQIPIDKKGLEIIEFAFPAANGEGFYLVSKVKRKTTGYAIEKVNNDLTTVWKTDQIPNTGYKGVKDLINSSDRLAVWEEFGPKALSNKVKPAIVCFDAKTGKKIYQRDGYDGSSTIIYNELRIDKEGNLFAGGAYVNGEKYKSVNNHGIYLLKLDPNGKEIIYTKVGNEDRIQPALKANAEKGLALGSKDKVFIEDLIIDGDQIYVISEMFRKNVNMTPASIQQVRDAITGKFIGGPSDNDKSKFVFEIMDFMIFKFDAKGKLDELKPIHKEDNNKITVWNPYNGYGGQDLAKILSRMGWFDYGFTITNAQGQKYMVCSNNASPRKPEVMTYNFTDGYAQNKLNLKKETNINTDEAKVTYFKSMRNTNNTIAVAYYQRKLDKITINLENLFE